MAAFEVIISGGVSVITDNCLPGTSSLATFVRPPGGNRCCSTSADQGLRPWLRSRALRAETETIHCPPGTASLATFARPTGKNRSYSFIVYQGLRPWQHSSALRAGIDVVQCPPTRDFVPGYVRSPSGRKQKQFIAHQGLRSTPCVKALGMCRLRPPSGREQELFNVRLPGTSSLATFARPPGGKRTATWRHSPRLSPSARRADETYLKTTF